jgi:iron complex outermembrane recepter protein
LCRNSRRSGSSRICSVGAFCAALAVLRCMGSATYAADDSPNHFEIEATPPSQAISSNGPIQASAGQSGLDENATTSAKLDEIVVTARRREESAQSVPVAITALSGAQLADRGVTDFADLQEVVPDINLGNDTTDGGRKGIRISIRGVRSLGVAVYMSETVRDARAIYDLLYDLESVQVLKGPQGTLFGSNSTAGAILIQPKRPTDRLEGYIQGSVGNYDSWGATGVLNIPLAGDKAALRIATDFVARGGFIQGPTREYDTDRHVSLRASLALNPTEAISNYLTLDYYDLNSVPGANSAVSYLPCAQGGTAACLYATSINGLPNWVDAFNAATAGGPHRTNITQPLFQDAHGFGATNIAEGRLGAPFGGMLGDITLRTVLGYSRFRPHDLLNASGLILDVTTTDEAPDQDRWSGELQALGNIDNGAVDWVVGTYFARNELHDYHRTDLFVPTTVGNRISPQETFIDTDTRQKALYGQASIRLVEGLTATAGARTTVTDQEATNGVVRNGVCALPAATPNLNTQLCRVNQSNSDHQPSYTLGLDYKLTPRALLYLVTRRGFSAGGFNAQGIDPRYQAFKPEILEDYEVGLKSDWRLGDMPVRTNIAVFHNDYSNIQRTVTIVQGNPAGPAALTINVAAAKIDGVEFDVGLTPADGLRLDLAGSYIDARYTSFPFSTDGVTFVDLKGNALAEAPTWTFSGTVKYDFAEFAGVGRPSISTNVSYQSRVFFSDLNQNNKTLNNKLDPFASQKAYALVNAQASIEDVGGSRASVDVYVNNLFDQFYYQSITNSGPAIGWVSGVIGVPRTFGAKVRYDF